MSWQDGELLLQNAATGIVRRYRADQVVWPERTRHGRRQLLLPDGGVIDVADAGTWDQWADKLGLKQPIAARLALSWRAVLLVFALLLTTVAVAWRWGIPWAAEQVIDQIPAELEQRFGRRVMDELKQQALLQPSTLPEALQRRIAEAVAEMVQAAYPPDERPAFRLHLFSASARLGPNAFALPGGDIVVTDALVELLQEGSAVSPALLGVIAHELGHVRGRHGMRRMVETGAISALTGWWIGDYSAILAGAPTLFAQAGYSRNHERSADAEALRVMRAARLDPRAMANFFRRLKATLPKRDGEDRWLGLASHPTDNDRVRFFEEGAKGSP